MRTAFLRKLVYSSSVFGKTFALSTPVFFMNGSRSAHMPEEQYWPTLLVVKDETTSGASSPPARSAWFIVSSVTLPIAFTVMLGCSFSKRAMLSSMALTSPRVGPAVPERQRHRCGRIVAVTADARIGAARNEQSGAGQCG